MRRNKPLASVQQWLTGALTFAAGLYIPMTQAEIGKIYTPQVDYLEKEVEYQYLSRQPGADLQNLSLGYSWHPRLAAEVYLYSEQLTHSNEKIDSVEAELRWQITEQGEYSSDWGMMFELSRSNDISSYEAAVGLLWEKALAGRWVGTVNTFVEYEFGSDIDNEWETALRAQLRYRHSPLLEPALELFVDDQDKALGPVWLGQVRVAPRHRVSWQFGAYLGLDDTTPDRQVRLTLEWEFM